MTQSQDRDLTVPYLLSMCEEEGECLIWQGSYGNNHLPLVYDKNYRKDRGRSVNVRRIFSELLDKKRPEGKGVWVMKCDTVGCVKPEHTIFRTASEHAAFMARKLNDDRTAIALRNRKLMVSAKRKIPFDDISAIISSSESCKDLAKRYDVNPSIISKYRRRGNSFLSVGNVWSGLIR